MRRAASWASLLQCDETLSVCEECCRLLTCCTENTRVKLYFENAGPSRHPSERFKTPKSAAARILDTEQHTTFLTCFTDLICEKRKFQAQVLDGASLTQIANTFTGNAPSSARGPHVNVGKLPISDPPKQLQLTTTSGKIKAYTISNIHWYACAYMTFTHITRKTRRSCEQLKCTRSGRRFRAPKAWERVVDRIEVLDVPRCAAVLCAEAARPGTKAATFPGLRR